MSGAQETDVARGAPERPTPQPPRTSVFDVPGPTPTLPPADATASPAFQRQAEPTPMARPAAPNPTVFYRSDQERAKSVYRRANPWYRRLARGVVAACMVVVLGGALYFGARALQDYLGRDRLPEVGAEVPDFRTSTFSLTSTAPAPALEGELSVDAVSGAFLFRGLAGESTDIVDVASVDGVAVAISRDNGATWSASSPDDPAVAEVLAALPYLTEVESADDLLANRVRNFVSLTDEATEGLGDEALERYEMEFDTAAFAVDNPLLWASFQQDAVPAVAESDDVPITMWIDNENVLVRLRDGSSNWSWQRTAYNNAPLDIDPTGEIRAASGA